MKSAKVGSSVLLLFFSILIILVYACLNTHGQYPDTLNYRIRAVSTAGTESFSNIIGISDGTANRVPTLKVFHITGLVIDSIKSDMVLPASLLIPYKGYTYKILIR